MIWTIATKDWRIEGRARDILTATLFFAATTVLILGLALGPDQERLRVAAPGILWTAIAFAAVLAAGRAFAAEAEDGALEALLLYPVTHELIYLGKFLANFGFLMVLSIIVTVISIFIYSLDITNWPILLAILFLGSLGFSLISTFYSALTVNLRARESLLPVLIFPLVVPVVLGAIKATSLATTNGNLNEIYAWLQLLLGFDAIYLVACTLVFPLAIEN